jgi:hypothetical protein
MRRLIIAAIAASGLWFAAPSAANADILDEVIAFYNPDLKPARPVIECALGGTALQTCAINAGQQKLLAEAGGTIQQVLELMTLVDEGKYHAVIARAGIVAACAWMSFPGKDYLCSDVAGQVYEVGKAAAEATVGVVAETAKFLAEFASDLTGGLAEAGKDIYCSFTGCSSSGGSGISVSVDAERVWHDCFETRTKEGLAARTAGVGAWANLTSLAISAEGYFAPGSLAGACANTLLKTFSSAPEPKPPSGSLWNIGALPPGVGAGSPAGQNLQPSPEEMRARRLYVASHLQAVYTPMTAKYLSLIEPAAANVLGPVSARYADLQAEWTTQAKALAADWFLASAPVTIVLGAKRNACRTALNGDPATSALSGWSQTGVAIGSSATVGGRVGAAWLATEAPQPWCQSGFIGAFNESVAARKSAYQEALAGGCTKVDNVNTHLVCPALSTAGARCLHAFAGSTNGKCDVGPATPLQPTGPITPQGPIPGVAPPEVSPGTAPRSPANPGEPVTRMPRVRIPTLPQTAPSPRG